MAVNIDFLSGSCKQDVTDLICLSAHLNLNRKLEAEAKQRLEDVWGEEMKTELPWRSTHFLIGFPEFKMGTFVTVHVLIRAAFCVFIYNKVLNKM